ncbi:CatA-like O-acetyltransferase [uncultured Kiloniella sp.]|uniref:CatA-like O-acetyltransferase n=1 Tax=uncultured Kiloniella sp. TaxID=1133091 RepID=UPI002601EB9F|nr:CatA-like O-acetyltransferase [uncultured Kiloniella sp.]
MNYKTKFSEQTEREINLSTWSRQSQYAMFKDFGSPHFSITTRIDVSEIMRAKQSDGASPFNAMLFCIMQAFNDVPELRTRLRDKDGQQSVIEHNIVHPSVTVPIENDRFAFCEIPYAREWSAFNNNCEIAIAEGKAQTELDEKTIDTDFWIFMSCIPWLDFTDMQHPLKGPDDCVPRLAWGKFVPKITHQDQEGWEVAVNLTAHHALADGIHMAKFFQKLADACCSFSKEPK